MLVSRLTPTNKGMVPKRPHPYLAKAPKRCLYFHAGTPSIFPQTDGHNLPCPVASESYPLLPVPWRPCCSPTAPMPCVGACCGSPTFRPAMSRIFGNATPFAARCFFVSLFCFSHFDFLGRSAFFCSFAFEGSFICFFGGCCFWGRSAFFCSSAFEGSFICFFIFLRKCHLFLHIVKGRASIACFSFCLTGEAFGEVPSFPSYFQRGRSMPAFVVSVSRERNIMPANCGCFPVRKRGMSQFSKRVP